MWLYSEKHKELIVEHWRRAYRAIDESFSNEEVEERAVDTYKVGLEDGGYRLEVNCEQWEDWDDWKQFLKTND